jgi:NAD(P)H-binding
MRVCIVGASVKLGQCMVQHALDRGYEVVGVCREESVEKLDAFKERITVVSGATNDREVVKRAVARCDGRSSCWFRGEYTATRQTRPRRTLPCSWWRPSRTTSSSTRPRPSSAARRPPRSRTPRPNEVVIALLRDGTQATRATVWPHLRERARSVIMR